MAVSRSQLGILSAQSKADQVGQPKSGKQQLFRINKGAPKQNKKWGKDLTTHFRLTPEDDNSFLVNLGGRTQEMDLDRILFELYGSRPGTPENKIKLRIENLDGVLRTSAAHVEKNNLHQFRLEMMRWACYKAQAMRRGGDPIDVAIMSPNGKDVVMERFGLRAEYYDHGTVLVDGHDRIVDNTPDSAGKFYQPDGKKIPYDILCYLYSASESKHVLCPFDQHGYLEFTFSELTNFGIPGIGVLQFKSSNDIASISRGILPVAERCARLSVPLSQIEFEMWREVEEINRPAFDDLSKSLDERRLNGGKKKNGTIRIKITQLSNMMLTNIEFQSGQNQLQLAQTNVGLLSATNSDLYGDDGDEPLQITANAPIEGEVELEDEEEVVAVYIEDEEIEDAVVATDAPDWQNHLDVVTSLAQPEMLDLFVQIHGLSNRNDAYQQMKPHSRTWPKTAAKQKQVWEKMNNDYLNK